MTLVEMMIAAVLLVTGVLATYALVDMSNRSGSNAASREGATNIARELLESAHGTPFARIGATDWVKPKLTAISGGDGSVSAPNGHTNVTSVTRRSTTYAVTLTWCSLDDGRDGHGSHDASIAWCADSTATAVADPQPEDFKRVAVRLAWTVNGTQHTLDQLATFSASGVAIGPAVSSLSVTAPAVSNPAAPTILANPANGTVTLRAVSPGAAGMRFTVDGAEQAGGTAAGGGAWTFNWNISNLKDGVYVLGAVAIDALGTRGEPRTLQITLNRGSPAPIANLTGGYNYVTIGGRKTLVLEGTWDANTEGNIIGYEVLRGSTVVCATSLATSCVDTNPALTGTTTYTFRTWYRDGAGVARSVASSINAAAPSVTPLPTQYHLTYNSSSPGGTHTGTRCRGAGGSGTKFDMLPAAPAFGARTSGAGWVSGCLPPLPAGVTMSASSMTVASRWVNSSSTDCSNMPVYLYLNGTTPIAGTGINGGNTLPKIPKNTQASSPHTSNITFNTSARSFAANDQLSIHTPASTLSSSCAGVSMYFNGSSQSTSVTLPLSGGGSANLAYPAQPTGLVATANGDGTTSLTWNAPGGSPAPDFYRIYRDGLELENRYDTAGDTGAPTITWTDTDTGGSPHVYYVTSASETLVESTMSGPVTR